MTTDQGLLDLIPVSIFTRNPQGRIVSWNKASEVLYGRPRDEAVGRMTSEILPTEYPASAAELEDHVIQHGRWDGELIRTIVGGRQVTIAASWSLLRDASGAPAGIMEAGLDITAYKHLIGDLQQNEQRYRNLFDYMPIPAWRNNSTKLGVVIAELRAQGITDIPAYVRAHPEFLERAMGLIEVEEANQAAARLFGVAAPGDLYGPVRKRWVSPEAFRRALEARYRGEETFSGEVKFTTNDGRAIEGVLFSAFPPPLSVSGISLNTFVDVTERNRAQEMLQKMQAEFAHAARLSILGELTASIAHEVNQPLAAIATNGEAGLRWLNRAEPDLNEARELMKRMVGDARRAADIIARVRGMATRGVYQRVPVSLHQVVDEALLFLGHEIQLRGVSVSFDRAAALPNVMADRTQLQQVVVNLAVNAMQAMVQADAPRTLRVSTTLPAPSTVCCTVEDSGPGVAPEHLDRMFESFFTTKDSGMGMGLAICRSIIEAHSGRIQVDNRSTYGGARFSFTLPAAQSS